MNRVLVALLLICLDLPATACAASVREQGGDIFYDGENGVSRQLTSLHADTEPLLVPDGQAIVYLRENPKNVASDSEQTHEIWFAATSGKDAHRLLDTKPDDAPEKNLAEFNSLAFSADGSRLYFLSAAWATSNALHVLDMSTGKEHFVTDANTVLPITQGKYAGYLVVQKHKYFKRSGSYDYYWLIAPDGKEIKLVGKTEQQLERFIHGLQRSGMK